MSTPLSSCRRTYISTSPEPPAVVPAILQYTIPACTNISECVAVRELLTASLTLACRLASERQWCEFSHSPRTVLFVAATAISLQVLLRFWLQSPLLLAGAPALFLPRGRGPLLRFARSRHLRAQRR